MWQREAANLTIWECVAVFHYFCLEYDRHLIALSTNRSSSTSSLKVVLFMLTEGDALFVRAGHHSWAAMVISGSAPCVLRWAWPIAHGLLHLHLSERQLEGQGCSHLFKLFFSSESPVYCSWFLLLFLLAKSGCSLMPEWIFKYIFFISSRSFHLKCLFPHTLTFTLLAHTLTQYLTKLAVLCLWGNH